MSYKLYTGNDGKRHWVFDVGTRKFKELEDSDVDDIQNREDLYPLNSKKSLIYFNKLWGIYLFMKCDKIISVPSDWLESFKEADITNASIIKTKNGDYTMRNRVAYNTEDLACGLTSEFLQSICVGFMESMRWLREAGITPCEDHVGHYASSFAVAQTMYNLLRQGETWSDQLIKFLADLNWLDKEKVKLIFEGKMSYFELLGTYDLCKAFPFELNKELYNLQFTILEHRTGRGLLEIMYGGKNAFNVHRVGVEIIDFELKPDKSEVYAEIPVRLDSDKCVTAHVYLTGNKARTKVFTCDDKDRLEKCPYVHNDFITFLYLTCNEESKSLLEPYILKPVTREDRLKYFDRESSALLEHASDLYGYVYNKNEIMTELHNITLQDFMSASAFCLNFNTVASNNKKLLKYFEFKDGDFAKVEDLGGGYTYISYYQQGEFIGGKTYNFRETERYFLYCISQKEREISLKEFVRYFRQEWVDLDDYNYSSNSVILPRHRQRYDRRAIFYMACINRLTGAIYVCAAMCRGVSRSGCYCLGSENEAMDSNIWLKKMLLCNSLEKAMWVAYLLNKMAETRVKKDIAIEAQALIESGVGNFQNRQKAKEDWGIIGAAESRLFSRLQAGRYID